MSYHSINNFKESVNLKGKTMDQLEITKMLNDLNIPFRVVEHPAAMTIEEIDRFALPNSEAIAKNLFVRDDKKKNYYLITVRKDKKVDLKELRRQLNSRPLSFASENDLKFYLGLNKGAVTPLGILNDIACRVQFVLDQDLTSFPLIGVHPNRNTATLWLSPLDLQALIEKHGNKVILVKL